MNRSNSEAASILHQAKHEFAVYLEEHLSTVLTEGQKFLVIDDPSTIHRIRDVLRLKPDDPIIFFDAASHALCRLQQASRKELLFQVISSHNNIVLTPSITALVPLLKRDNLEQVVYDVTAIGVTTIQLVVTAKVQRAWQHKDLVRLQKISIAAAEQAKNFSLAIIKEPITFEDILVNRDNKTYCIFADPNGKPLLEVMHDISVQRPQELQLLVGPEGDLTEGEKNRLQNLGFVFCKLTPTVLKSSQAMAILAAVCRSL